MSHFLPHLTQSTSTSSLSPIFPTISPTHTRPSVHDECLPCDVPRQSGGSTHIPSLTRYEPKLLIETEAIEPEDLEPRTIELDRILGTDPCQEDMDEFGKVGAEMSYIESDYEWTHVFTFCTDFPKTSSDGIFDVASRTSSHLVSNS